MSYSFTHKSKLSTVGTGTYVFRHYGVGGGGPLTYTYTGTCTESTITSGGVSYKLLTLTTNGTLTFSRQATVDIWACGGGSNGLRNTATSGSVFGHSTGGAGAYCSESDAVAIQSINVVIGPANTASGTVITGDTLLTAAGVNNSKNGGTGGGTQETSSSEAGTGDSHSKYPFSDSTNFQPHCGGGAAGVLLQYSSSSSYSYNRKGGAGGTNGGNSGIGSRINSDKVVLKTTYSSNSGGSYGGGAGGNGTITSTSSRSAGNGGNATFYGSGGGGPGVCRTYNGSSFSNQTIGNVGNGYQGVCYVRIPASEF